MKPLVLSDIQAHWANLEFNLHFRNNVTLIMGNSGTGKTILYRAINTYARNNNNNNIICLDRNSEAYIDTILNNGTGRFILIDNADTLLLMRQRAQLAMDPHNQYVIITHCVNGYMCNENSLAELKIENNIGKLVYPFIEE